MFVFLAIKKNVVIIRGVWQRSSVVEQRNHNPLVGGPNPSAATRINKRPDGSFFYSVRRGGDGHPDGGPTRRQRGNKHRLFGRWGIMFYGIDLSFTDFV